jgi:hypothetical protein
MAVADSGFWSPLARPTCGKNEQTEPDILAVHEDVSALSARLTLVEGVLHEDDGADFLVAQQGSRTRARDHDGVPFVKYSVVVYEHWTGATVVQLLSEILIAREFVELAGENRNDIKDVGHLAYFLSGARSSIKPRAGGLNTPSGDRDGCEECRAPMK